MDAKTALAGMLDARHQLASKEGITSLPLLSENMQRLAAYTSAVEEHLANQEAYIEASEGKEYLGRRQQGESVTAAEREARAVLAKERGDLKKLSRLVNSSWKLINTTQSRYNHLYQESRGQV